MKRPRGAGRIFKRGDILWVQYYSATGKQIRESSHSEDPKVAEKLLRQRVGAVAAGVGPDSSSPSYRKIRDGYLRHRLSQIDKSLPRRVNGTLILGGDGLPQINAVSRCDLFFENVRINKIDSDMLDEFVIKLREQGYANGSINRSLSALRAMFYLAQEKGKVRHVPSFPMLPEAKPRQGFFTREEYRRLLNALPVHLKPLLAIGYATGMRVSEIRGLRWSQVDFLNRLITLNPGETKNDEGRAAPITEELDIILRAHRQACPKNFPWVCYFIAKGHPQRVRTFDVAWNNCCAKIGLGKFVPATDGEGNPLYHLPRGPRSKPKPRMKYNGKLFHDLRRVGVRNLVDAGVPETVAMKISGHKTRSIFDRYNIRNQRDVQAAGRALDRFVVEEEKKFGDISGTFRGQYRIFLKSVLP